MELNLHKQSKSFSLLLPDFLVPLFVLLSVDVRHLLLLGDLLAPEHDEEAAEERAGHHVGREVHAEVALSADHVTLPGNGRKMAGRIRGNS